MKKETIDILILIGRPASGKSEIIDYLKHLPPGERIALYHLAELDVLDDFPMLWAWFEEDEILDKKLSLPRLYNDEQGYFKHKEYWHLLIERLCLDYQKRRRDPDYLTNRTAIIEFSRGSEHGGYGEAFLHLSNQVLECAAVVYVEVTFAEAFRKNRRRFNSDRPDSILEHGLSDEKMERLYLADDFSSIASGDSGWLSIRGYQIPFVIFPNQDDITTGNPEALSARLQEVLGRLWRYYPTVQR